MSATRSRLSAQPLAVLMLTAALGLALSSTAHSQSDDVAAGPPPGGPMHHVSLEQRLGNLKTALAITSAQESLWEAYSTAATNLAAAHKSAFAQIKSQTAPLTTPQRIDQRNAMSAQIEPSRQALDSATKALYASLTPAQQLTFELSQPHHGGHAHGGWGGH